MLEQLDMLNSLYKDKGVVILGFPCSQIFSREFGTNEEIQKYVTEKNVKFRIFQRVEVNGKNACELYKLLRKQSELNSTQIGMNFGRFIVDREGNVKSYHRPTGKPSNFINDIKSVL